MQLRQFSHKLWIRERSTLKDSTKSIKNKYRLIRAAWKFEVGFGDIFVLLLCKIENPLFYTFTKDSRFYIVKARKYRPKRTPYGCSSDLTYAMFREFLSANLSGITSISHSLWKNYTSSILERLKHVFSIFKKKRRKFSGMVWPPISGSEILGFTVPRSEQ